MGAMEKARLPMSILVIDLPCPNATTVTNNLEHLSWCIGFREFSKETCVHVSRRNLGCLIKLGLNAGRAALEMVPN
jgi:hypothetical protein